MRFGRQRQPTLRGSVRNLSGPEVIVELLEHTGDLRLAAAGCLYTMGLVEHKPSSAAPRVGDWTEFSVLQYCENVIANKDADNSLRDAASGFFYRERVEPMLLRPATLADSQRLLRPSAFGEVNTNELLRPQDNHDEE